MHFLNWELAAQEKESPQLPKTTIYYLKHAQAGDVERLILALYADTEHAAQIKVVADNRTNALLINGSDKIIKEIEELLKVLDAAQVAKPEVRVVPIDEIKVFTLKNAAATECVHAINSLQRPGVQISADARTNTVIATGPKQELEIVEALVMKLDESQNKTSLDVRVYPLQNASAEKAVDILNQLGMNALISMDAEKGRLLVRGNEESHLAVKEFLQTIDVAEANPVLQPMQLRIVWLVEEKLAGKDAREPAKNLEKVIQVLNDKLGVTNLKMAAQLLVTIDPSQEEPNQTFTAYGTTALQEGFSARLEAVGQIVGQIDGKPTIQLSIQASQPDAERDPGGFQGAFQGRSSASSSRTLASLTTKVAAPIGHSIVLGMTPIQSADSVFVLQVLSAEDPSAAPKETPKN